LIWRIIAISLAALVLGAHFLRDGNILLTVVFALSPLLLLIKQRWVLWVLQAIAYVGAVLWLQTAIQILNQRLLLGEPWLRMVIILGVVAAFSVFAGVLMNGKVMQDKYSR